MSDIRENDIPIKSVSSSDADPLLKCFFRLKQDGTYTFYEKPDKVKRRDIELGSEFSVLLDQFPDALWHLTLNRDPEPTVPEKYFGTWRNASDQNPSLAEGTYQAEAGGTGEEGDESAASAGSY